MKFSFVYSIAISVLIFPVCATGLSAQGLQQLATLAATGATPGSPGKNTDYHVISPGLRWGGSLRTRAETKQNFKFNSAAKGNDENYFLSQFRINLQWTPSDAVTFFIEGQDARIFGQEAINEKARPNIFADDFDLHQAHLTFQTTNKETTPVKVKVGRQKLILGAQRMISPLEWVNTARVWDGARVTVGRANERTLDVFATRVVPVDPKGWNDYAKTGNRLWNSGFHGVYFTDWKLIRNTRVEAYWLLRHEQRQDDRVHTLGARFDTKNGPWDMNGELMGQFGDYGVLDQSATAFHLGAGYTYQGTRIGGAFNYGSGDDDPNDGEHGTFDNQYPLNHAYYGFMDFFSLQNMRNAELTLKRKFAGKVAFRIAWQGFWLVQEDTDAWYNAGAGAIRNAAGGTDVDDYVGSEVDITIGVPVHKRVALAAGYSHLFIGSYVEQTGASDGDADFGYLQLKWNF